MNFRYLPEPKYEKCPKCKNDILFTCGEKEIGMCNSCQDKAINHANERAEWNYYHSGE